MCMCHELNFSYQQQRSVHQIFPCHNNIFCLKQLCTRAQSGKKSAQQRTSTSHLKKKQTDKNKQIITYTEIFIHILFLLFLTCKTIINIVEIIVFITLPKKA